MTDTQDMFDRLMSQRKEEPKEEADQALNRIASMLSKNPEMIDEIFDMKDGTAEVSIDMLALAYSLQEQITEHAIRIIIEGDDHTCAACSGVMLARAPFFTQLNVDAFAAYERSVHAILHVMRCGMEREGLTLPPPIQFPIPDWSAVDDPDSPEDSEPVPEDESCAACGLGMHACQGHGAVGDYEGWRILHRHDMDEHGECHPSGCEQAKEAQHG